MNKLYLLCVCVLMGNALCLQAEDSSGDPLQEIDRPQVRPTLARAEQSTGKEQTARIGRAQGEMTGEVTTTTAILQSRLTSSEKTAEGRIQGVKGIAQFAISTDSEFRNAFNTNWVHATSENDYMIKLKLSKLQPATRYYYRLHYGPNTKQIQVGATNTFRTLDEPHVAKPVSFVVTTGMNYDFFHFGKKGRGDKAYQGPDKHLGFPALVSMLKLQPDFFVGTGDNVYYDPGDVDQYRATTQYEMRRKWHEQFSQPRFVDLFAKVPTYWEKDDHDHRFNDCDLTGDRPPASDLGIKTFLEQVPIVDPKDPEPITYRTHRINKLLQIWLVEGRDYRSPNLMEDGPEKTIWGPEQLAWLKRTLQESDATFKIIISPTPMVGPDSNSKRDNHVNPRGFRHEGDAFFAWLKEKGFLEQNFYLVCGDRHWQYHARHVSGFEEFSCGALVDANAIMGIPPGRKNSSDPNATIQHFYTQHEASGGFLKVAVQPGTDDAKPNAEFLFYDENGLLLYRAVKSAR